jgi:hypothetical protein
MSVKSSTELMLYVVLTMPTLNKAYLLLLLYVRISLSCVAARILLLMNGKVDIGKVKNSHLW